MAEDNTKSINELEKDVVVLKHDVQILNQILTRLDDAVSKIGDVSNNINRVLAVHENRIEQFESVQTSVVKLIETVSTANIADQRTSIERTSQLRDQIKTDLDKHAVESARSMGTLKKMMEEARLERAALSNRVSKLENWKWLVVGGAMVVGYIGHFILKWGFNALI